MSFVALPFASVFVAVDEMDGCTQTVFLGLELEFSGWQRHDSAKSQLGSLERSRWCSFGADARGKEGVTWLVLMLVLFVEIFLLVTKILNFDSSVYFFFQSERKCTELCEQMSLDHPHT